MYKAITIITIDIYGKYRYFINNEDAKEKVLDVMAVSMQFLSDRLSLMFQLLPRSYSNVFYFHVLLLQKCFSV